MVRYACWLINSALFTLGCLLLADTANAIIAALLSKPPPAALEADPVSHAKNRDWSERQQIIDRNLFHSSALSAQAPEPEPVDEFAAMSSSCK